MKLPLALLAVPVTLALGSPVLIVVAAAGGLAGRSADRAIGAPAPTSAARTLPNGLLPLYQQAATDCRGLPWTVLAGVGSVETAHATLPGGERYPIAAGLGWAFRITSPAGAQGPMQFMPGTWAAYGADADQDGRANADDPVDAVHAAARYLCANGAGEPGRLRAALFAYNHDESYVEAVLRRAEDYGGRGAAAAPAVADPRLGGHPQVAAYALRFLGIPYRWGGADPSGFDCSGLTQYVWARFGVAMEHYTVSQFRAFPRVPAGQELPGDLVFFRGAVGDEPPGHEGLYLGAGRFVHAPHTGDVVRIGTLAERSDYMGAVRPASRPGGLAIRGRAFRRRRPATGWPPAGRRLLPRGRPLARWPAALRRASKRMVLRLVCRKAAAGRAVRMSDADGASALEGSYEQPGDVGSRAR